MAPQKQLPLFVSVTSISPFSVIAAGAGRALAQNVAVCCGEFSVGLGRTFEKEQWRALGDSNPCYRRERDRTAFDAVHKCFQMFNKHRCLLDFLCVSVRACPRASFPAY